MESVRILKKAAALLVFVSLCLAFHCLSVFGAGGRIEHTHENTVRIYDQKGNLVTMTARKVFAGDEIITAAGDYYRVVVVRNKDAQAKLVGKDENYLAWTDYFHNYAAVTAANWGGRPVGVYHTHTDESYLPSDGKPSIPFRGGIYQVGNEFVESLQENKVDVKYYKTPHDPHDNNAYTRSRRTAMGLLKSNPIALFDIHRDGVPDPDFFKEEVSGEDVAQLRIVVGRQNPKMKSNMDFASRLMAYANKVHPGLVKEIYKGQGNYNQDLLSTAILLEAGTYTNNKALAENGIKFLAEAVPVVLGVNNPGTGITSDEAGNTGWNVALWLVLLTLLAGSFFSILNFGWKGTIDGLKRLGRRFAESEIWIRIQQTILNSYRWAREGIENFKVRKYKQ